MAGRIVIIATRFNDSGGKLFIRGAVQIERESSHSRAVRIAYTREMFEILVNGIPRTYRDQEGMAIDAGRVLRDRDKSEITVINLDTRQWAIITDPFSAVAWRDAPGLTVVRQT